MPVNSNMNDYLNYKMDYIPICGRTAINIFVFCDKTIDDGQR
jgi:hypothetical protein